MSIAGQCEDMFSRADDIGAGVAALGDMLQWAPPEDVRRTLAGLGSVLRQLGGDIQSLSEAYFHEGYGRIAELEAKAEDETRLTTLLAELKTLASERKSVKEELKAILDEAFAESVEQAADSPPPAAPPLAG